MAPFGSFWLLLAYGLRFIEESATNQLGYAEIVVHAGNGAKKPEGRIGIYDVEFAVEPISSGEVVTICGAAEGLMRPPLFIEVLGSLKFWARKCRFILLTREPGVACGMRPLRRWVRRKAPSGPGRGLQSNYGSVEFSTDEEEGNEWWQICSLSR